MSQAIRREFAAARASVLKTEILSGLTVSFAMVPEVVAFAFVAGVSPLIGLYAAFIAGLVTAVCGGRPGMISGGAGSLAVVSVTLVAAHGVEYLFATVTLMGILQALIGVFGWGKFIRLVPYPVMLGFVNGLAIVIFLAQLRQFTVQGHVMTGSALITMVSLVAVTVCIAAFLPRVTRVLPSSLAAIIVVTLCAHLFGLHTRTVGDLAILHGFLPTFHLPAVPWTLQTARIILPYAVTLAGVGLTESLLTQELIDSLTETRTSSNQECIGQGLANIATGLFGGMGGCAMIGQSILNIESGGRQRLSGIVEALCILSFIVFASSLISLVPMAALVGVMFVVVYKTFAWSSLRILHRIPRADAFVLVLVSVVTVFTNLATAVVVGVIVSALKFSWTMATSLSAKREIDARGWTIYELHGPLFFGSVRRFQELFDPNNDTSDTLVDFRYSYLYDHSALQAVSIIAEKYLAQGKMLHLQNLSPDCQKRLERAGDIVNTQISKEPHQHIATMRLAERKNEHSSCLG